MNTLLFFMLSLYHTDSIAYREFPSIDSMVVFCEFKQKGYTTAGAQNRIVEFKKHNLEKHQLSIEDCRRIEKILKSARSKNHHQRKFGITNVFFECIVKDKIGTRDCILGKGKDFYVFTDLTDKVEYFINSTDDVRYIEDLLERLRLFCNK